MNPGKGFALRSERALIDGRVQAATVLVEGGFIAEVFAEGQPVPEGVEVVELGSHVLMPGLIDPHVHINDPGRSDWEGFETASKAAAAGGVTTLVDMPLNSSPVTTTREAFETKLAAARGRLWVDVGFWGGIVPGNLGQLTGLADDGVLGFKAFMCHSGLDEFPDSDEATLREAMKVLAPRGLPLLAHAEIELDSVKVDGPPSVFSTFSLGRPRAWEEAAISMLVGLCRETGCPVHVVHLASASALPMLREARSQGLPITVETCPHYLVLKDSDVGAGETVFKCAPPLRGVENLEGLWEGLLDGTIDFIATDHSPCPPQMKPSGDFLSAWGGISSLQLALPLMWTEVSRRGGTLVDMERWLSAGPARLAGLSASRGRIAAGHRADLVAWDAEARWTISPQDLYMRHKVSPFIGRQVTGQVVTTWLAGVEVYARDSPSAAPHGRALLGRDGPM